GTISETLCFAAAWYVQRNSSHVLKKLKPAEVNVDLKIEDATIDEVSVRIYSPLNLSQDKNKYLPAISFYHRGAFYMGSVETHHPITRRLAIQTGFIVISVEYRLASEHPFPAGVDDWDSAGGNLAAVIAMQLANNANSVNVPRIQVLIYLVVQFFDFMLPSYLTSILNIFD
ncbi:unnamed protein product, partial [Rotaria sp. Silwood2]